MLRLRQSWPIIGLTSLPGIYTESLLDRKVLELETEQSRDREPDINHLDTESRSPVNRTRNVRVFLGVLAAIVIILDVLTKVSVVRFLEGRRPVHMGFVDFLVVRNPGAAFSLATGSTWILTVVALALVVVIVRIGQKLESFMWAVGFGLILGGALGNLIDRFFRFPGPFRGHVVDFISIGWWPVFNIADSAICCGVAIILIEVLLGVKPDGGRERG